MEKKIYTVTELTTQIRMMLEMNLAEVWVEGEISNFKFHSSGHMYFDLKDENSILPAVMFRRANTKLKFTPENGMKVIANGGVSIYEKQGKYQLIVETLEPAGKGALFLAFEQLKAKLEKEGLFAPEHKKPIPPFPQKIGIVTSLVGAAIRDILNIIGRRFAGVEVIINPVQVQGEGAKEEIANAIQEFNLLEKRLRPDVLIVGRGGGSLEDLWAFNEEIVARAIYDSRIPIISAVGHETDFTICDFVADVRAPTPSAAAELVVKNKEEVWHRVEFYITRLHRTVFSKFQLLEHRFTNLYDNLLFRHPQRRINKYQQQVDDFVLRSTSIIRHLLEMEIEGVKILDGKLKTLNPEAILQRGYSITFLLPEREIVKDAGKVKKDDELEIRVKKGIIQAKVK